MSITQYFHYCPKCKSVLDKKQHQLIVCGQCGFHFYFGPHLANAVILENEHHEILLVKRKSEPKKGFWDLPGGFVEIDETIEESLHREINEELNVGITDFKYISSAFDTYLYNKIKYHTLCVVFSAKIISGQIRPADDVSSITFFPESRIPYDRIAFRGLKTGIKQYLLSSHQSHCSGNTQK